MDESNINELNKKFCIHFPVDELAVYMHGSELDTKAIPDLKNRLSILGIPLKAPPDRIIFRSRHAEIKNPPDQTISLLAMKKANPGVEFNKLERLYTNNMLLKYWWIEPFSAEDLSWGQLLGLCDQLVKRSATDYDEFLRFSIFETNTLELITN